MNGIAVEGLKRKFPLYKCLYMIKQILATFIYVINWKKIKLKVEGLNTKKIKKKITKTNIKRTIPNEYNL